FSEKFNKSFNIFKYELYKLLDVILDKDKPQGEWNEIKAKEAYQINNIYNPRNYVSHSGLEYNSVKVKKIDNYTFIISSILNEKNYPKIIDRLK
ncbi:MAG: hypothetical protein N3F09_10190, partial [Bacteroidia bacterium]|nr:hypothetical protein [Bacteroidia bacterium]